MREYRRRVFGKICSRTNMTFVDRISILQSLNSFSHKIYEAFLPQEPCLPFLSKISAPRAEIRKEPRWYSETNNPAPKSDIRQQLTYQEILQIFVLGPSIYGKARLIECATNRNLVIRTQKDIDHAYELNGFLLQGVEVAINLWHVGEIFNSLSILRDYYQKYKTCFMMVYDVNDRATFQFVHQWISSLRSVLGGQVPIVLVGYEDTLPPEQTLKLPPEQTLKLTPEQTLKLTPEQTLKPTPELTLKLLPEQTLKLTPVSYAEGMKAKEELELKTYYEFSDMTGPAVIEMVFDAAHIALESKVTIPDSEMAELEEK